MGLTLYVNDFQESLMSDSGENQQPEQGIILLLLSLLFHCIFTIWMLFLPFVFVVICYFHSKICLIFLS